MVFSLGNLISITTPFVYVQGFPWLGGQDVTFPPLVLGVLPGELPLPPLWVGGREAVVGGRESVVVSDDLWELTQPFRKPTESSRSL